MTVHTSARTRDERGESLPMLLLGIALAPVIIGAFWAFWLSQHEDAVATRASVDRHTAVLHANNAISAQIDNATYVRVDAIDSLRIDTPTEAIHWSIVDPDGDGRGDLVSQRAPLGTTDWSTVPTKRSTSGVSAAAFEQPSDNLIRLLFDANGNGQPDLPTAVRIP